MGGSVGHKLSTLSAILIVGLLPQTQHLGIHFIARSEPDLELYCPADLRGPQVSAGLLTLEAKAEIEQCLADVRGNGIGADQPLCLSYLMSTGFFRNACEKLII